MYEEVTVYQPCSDSEGKQVNTLKGGLGWFLHTSAGPSVRYYRRRGSHISFLI